MSNWIEKDHALYKTFTFNSFNEAMDWMSKMAPKIDALNHHPEWTNVYNKVMVKLTTHDAGNTVTEKDYTLAKLLDEVTI
ncbi:MAG: 4a-hydroxytetrahydrobiopterin dehydratase [Bacteroidota bacterium]|jgi:4a-hydroxytetrahydrobiopterin dehydratase